ncbi:MAG: class I SAM-dependent methyltransferase [Sulfuritalea sp.]|nr:class I SAM-dependent methyltransferase [Sulfuritalea sp.]
MKRFAAMLGRALFSWMAVRGVNAVETAEGTGGNNSRAAEIFRQPGQKFLHVGCGESRMPDVGPGFRSGEWNEIRLDIDPAAVPDIVSSMLDMSLVPTEAVDAVYSSHNVEHLYPHEVPVALAEFFRVLKPDGLLVLGCPDLQSLSRLIVDDRLDQPAYMSPAGPIAPLDVLYGHRPQLADGNLFMAHHMGFTLRTLVEAVRSAGFRAVAGQRRDAYFDLWVVASKNLLSEQEMQALAATHLPQ